MSDSPAKDPDEPVPGIDLSEPEVPEPDAPAPEDPGTGAGTAGATDPATDEPPTAAPAAVPPPPATASAPPPSPERKPTPWLLIAGVVAAALVVVLAIVLTRDNDEEPSTATSTTTTLAPIDTDDWETAEVSNFQFSVRHPEDWERLEIKDDVKVLLRFGPENVFGVTVRDVAAADAPNVIDQAMSQVQLLEEPGTFVVDGFPGAVYIYSKEKTAESPDEGVVVHYFVVANTKLYAMVFAVSPPEELNRVARTISAVANTFTSTAEKPPAPTTTTAPAADSTTTTTGG